MGQRIVVTGGAGAIGGALGYAAKQGLRVAGLEVALRDGRSVGTTRQEGDEKRACDE